MSDDETDGIQSLSEDESENMNQSPTSPTGLDVEEDDSEVPSDDDDEDGLTEGLEDGSETPPLPKGEIQSNASNLKTLGDLPESILQNEIQQPLVPPSDVSDDESDDEDEENLKKFDKEVREEFLVNFHPESVNHNYDEIYTLSGVIRNKDNIIIDDLHRTLPILSKYEKTRVLGQRAKQINTGSKPFIEIDENIINGYLIAQEELHQKKIPFIIRRPLPSGGSEYWYLADLEVL
jgi:DNA-directed RNA polymerases I, II, and III subunit RPABC2